MTWSLSSYEQKWYNNHLLSAYYVPGLVLKALHVLISTLTSGGWYHHYSPVTDEETEVYKSSVTCPESHSWWEVKSGFECAITGCRYCCSYEQEKLLQSKPVSNLYLKLLAFDFHDTIICHHLNSFTVWQLFKPSEVIVFNNIFVGYPATIFLIHIHVFEGLILFLFLW